MRSHDAVYSEKTWENNHTGPRHKDAGHCLSDAKSGFLLRKVMLVAFILFHLYTCRFSVLEELFS